MNQQEPQFFPAKSRSCETCRNIEGHHYCLLYSFRIKNANLIVCSDWQEQEEMNMPAAQSKEWSALMGKRYLRDLGYVLLALGIAAVVCLVILAVMK
jgi:hypothetical protein